jgi:hypothetical protein
VDHVATWSVGEVVVRAVAALERLTAKNQQWLFALPDTSVYATRQDHNTEVKSTQSTNIDIGKLCDWISHYCQAHGRADGIPLVSGQRWRISTRQFRRTFAWFIAQRPGGSIAGAIQYRHQTVQMFEGYAKARELYQMGDKPQVASSRRQLNGLRHYYNLAA